MNETAWISLIWFLALVAFVAGWFLWAVTIGSRPDDEDEQGARAWTTRAVDMLVVWLGVPAAAALTGVLSDFSGRPPALMVAAVVGFLAMFYLAWSPLGTRLARGLSVAALVGFQAFRIPLELLLYRLHLAGVVPVQMTMAGLNFDVATGVLATLLGWWAMKGTPPRWALWAFNVVGTVLLLTIVVVSATSTPTMIRQFPDEPANRFVADFPYMWLPLFIVPAALFGHLVLFRRLATKTTSGVVLRNM